MQHPNGEPLHPNPNPFSWSPAEVSIHWVASWTFHWEWQGKCEGQSHNLNCTQKKCCDTVTLCLSGTEETSNLQISVPQHLTFHFYAAPFSLEWWSLPSLRHFGTWPWPLETVWMGRPQIPGCQRPQANGSVFRHRLQSFICIPGSNSTSEFLSVKLLSS